MSFKKVNWSWSEFLDWMASLLSQVMEKLGPESPWVMIIGQSRHDHRPEYNIEWCTPMF